MRSLLLCCFLVVVLARPAMAVEDAELRQVLSLLTAAHLGDDYAAVKKVVPGLGQLHPDAGDDNTEALVQTKIGKLVLRGEFNFAKGKLVSHGFSTGELTAAQAHDFLLRCTTILEDLYGDSKRHIILPADSDGPADEIGLSFNWHQDHVRFGLDFHFRRQFAKVSWGAQGD